jgi:hypothetical protein
MLWSKLPLNSLELKKIGARMEQFIHQRARGRHVLRWGLKCLINQGCGKIDWSTQ